MFKYSEYWQNSVATSPLPSAATNHVVSKSSSDFIGLWLSASKVLPALRTVTSQTKTSGLLSSLRSARGPVLQAIQGVRSYFEKLIALVRDVNGGGAHCTKQPRRAFTLRFKKYYMVATIFSNVSNIGASTILPFG